MLAWFWKRLSDGGPQVSVSGRALRRFPVHEVDRFLRARVLIERRRADTWPVCAHCDCGYHARPIRDLGGRLVACCPHDAAEDEVIEPDDLRRFGIDADRLAGALGASGGLSDAAFRLSDGFWLLGRTSTGRCVVLGFDTHPLMAPGAIPALKSAAGGPQITVIASVIDTGHELRLQDAGIDPRRLADCIHVDGNGLERLNLDGHSLIAAAPRLVLQRGSQSATLDGRRLDLPPQMFALFRLLAEQTGGRDAVLRKQTIEAQTGRPPNEIVRDLRKCLVSSGATREAAETLVVTVHGYGYRLGLYPSEVLVED